MEKAMITISLIGRPNVGKSSLFNSLMRKATLALAHNYPGVTRDRHYGVLTLEADDGATVDSLLVHTGGFYPQKIETGKNKQEKGFQKSEEEIRMNTFFNIMAYQAKVAIDEYDL